MLIFGLTGIVGAVVGALGGAYLLAPARKRGQAGWVEAADLTRLRVGVPEEVLFERTRVDGWRLLKEKASAWVVRKSGNEVVAFSPSCTHLGCAYNYDSASRHFICPCHTSAFSLDGKVLTGPAPRALDRYAVQVDGGKVLLGEIKRSVEKS